MVQCHYEYNGNTYECDGTDCDAAADELVDDMCGTSKQPADLHKAVTEQVVGAAKRSLSKVNDNNPVSCE
jgi:hypothetical protein